MEHGRNVFDDVVCQPQNHPFWLRKSGLLGKSWKKRGVLKSGMAGFFVVQDGRHGFMTFFLYSGTLTYS